MPSRNIAVCINEAAGGGVVVAGLEVVEASLGVVDIAAVAQGVDGSQGDVGGIRGNRGFSVGVVSIADHGCTKAVHDVEHIALEVGHIVVGGAVILQGIGVTALVIEEVQGVGAPGFPQELAAGIVSDGLAVVAVSRSRQGAHRRHRSAW